MRQDIMRQDSTRQDISAPRADSVTQNEGTGADEPVNRVWLAVIAGLLVATSNTWLFHPQLKQSSYSAPWVYPGFEPKQNTHTL
jgi:hypothetical protein